MTGYVCGCDRLQDCMVERAAVPPCATCIEGAREHPCTMYPRPSRPGICRRHPSRKRVPPYETWCQPAGQRACDRMSQGKLRQRLVARQHGRRAVPPCATCTEERPDGFQHNVTTTIGQSVYSASCRGKDCWADRCELHFHDRKVVALPW